MKIDSLEALFYVLLSDIYYVENELLTAIPAMIKKAQSIELKDGLRKHLEETKEQVKRLERCFKQLDIQPARVEWVNNLHSLFQKADSLLNQNEISPALDATIIVLAQHVEHYEIATYGTLIEFCKVLDFHEVKDLLEETKKEEYHADKVLNKLAEGGVFGAGINVKAIKH